MTIYPKQQCKANDCERNGTRHRRIFCVNEMEESVALHYCGTKIPKRIRKCISKKRCIKPSAITTSTSAPNPSSTSTLTTLTALPSNTSSSNSTTKKQKFRKSKWKMSKWSQCSASCGDGIQSRHSVCVSKSDTPCDASQRPADEHRVCRRTCSLFHWKEHEWTECSTTCGRGYKSRTVQCLDWTNTVVPNEFCDPANKPKHMRRCKKKSCSLVWDNKQLTKESHHTNDLNMRNDIL